LISADVFIGLFWSLS